MRTKGKVEFEREKRIAHLEIAIKHKKHDVLVLKMLRSYNPDRLLERQKEIEDLENELVEIFLLEGDEVEK